MVFHCFSSKNYALHKVIVCLWIISSNASQEESCFLFTHVDGLFFYTMGCSYQINVQCIILTSGKCIMKFMKTIMKKMSYFDVYFRSIKAMKNLFMIKVSCKFCECNFLVYTDLGVSAGFFFFCSFIHQVRDQILAPV